MLVKCQDKEDLAATTSVEEGVVVAEDKDIVAMELAEGTSAMASQRLPKKKGDSCFNPIRQEYDKCTLMTLSWMVI